jgi:hypothetical protein
MDTKLNEQMRYERARKRVRNIKGFYMHFMVYILVNAFLLVLHYASLKQGESFFTFGAFSTAFFWGFGLLLHGMGTFGPNLFLGNNWEERKIHKLMQQEEERKARHNS